MEKLLRTVTGAQPGEFAKTLYSFLALFCLLLSYYLIKPLRNSQFLKEFNPDFLPVVFLITPILSLVVTKIFNYFYDCYPRHTMIMATYGLIVACKIAFFFYLPIGGRWATVFFFFWASVYFLLAISLLWACINLIFNSAQAERCFGFIALGATLGNIFGSKLSASISQSLFKDYVLILASAMMGLALLLILKASAEDVHAKTPPPPDNAETAQGLAHFFRDLKRLFQNRYVRGIAVMVYVLAIFNTVFDFQSQKQIDRTLAHQEYQVQFDWFEKTAETAESGFAFVYGLKSIPENERTAAIADALSQRGLAEQEARFATAYQNYKSSLEGKTRALFSNVYFYQGILGSFLLIVVSRFLFRYAGLRLAVMILPLFFLGVGVALLFPMELMFFQTILVISGALNYSLNNATKELLYTPTSDETKFKHKPLIEGPIMRFGDYSAAMLKLLSSLVLVTWLDHSDILAEQFMVVLSLGCVLYWIYAIWFTGGEYDRKKHEYAGTPRS